jgi:hypothetical protein
MHTFQDTYSHKGAYPGNLITQRSNLLELVQLNFLRRFTHILDQPYQAITHNTKGTGILPRSIQRIDYAFDEPETTRTMAAETHRLLLAFIVDHPEAFTERLRSAAPFGSFDFAIDEFTAARTKAEKIRWMLWYMPEAIGLVPLRDISLPER